MENKNTEAPVILTNLRMHRTGLRDDGPLVGVVTFKGKLGDVSLTVNDATCNAILASLAEGAALAVANVADALRGQFSLTNQPKESDGKSGKQ